MTATQYDISETDCWCGPHPADVLVTGGCVHEHVRRRPACKRHLAMWRALGPLCAPCLDSDRGHDCPVRLLHVGPLDPSMVGAVS